MRTCCQNPSNRTRGAERALHAVYLAGAPNADVLLEVYGDNLCSFTKAAFPTLELLGKHYAGKVQI